MSTKNRKKSHAVLIVTIITVVAAVLCVASFIGVQKISEYRATALDQKQAEVDAINLQKDQEYAVALAEYEAATASGANLAWPAQSTEGWDVVDLTNYPLESAYTTTLSRQETMYNGLLLVNQWHSRPEDFSEENLVSVGTYTSGSIAVANYSVRLFENTINAFQDCLADAANYGFTYYMISEGYRSWDDQNTLFQKKVSALSGKYSGDALIEAAKKEVNYPGTSEFNTGLAFIVRLYKNGDSQINNLDYTTCDAGIWMSENSWRYGLIFRFPLTDYPMKGTTDKSYKTGISTKLKALRYVGKGNAAVMYNLDMCLEEYIEYLMEHPHIAVFEDGTLKYEIYRQYVGDAESFNVEITGKAKSYTSSLDNMGGLITVFEY